MEQVILALDVGTKIGYTIDGQNGLTAKLAKEDSKFLEFHQLIKNIEHIYGVTQIAYEAAPFQPAAAIPVWHGLVGVLKLTAQGLQIPVVGIAVGTIKKEFTGKGRHTKEEQRAAADRLGLKKANTKSPILDKCRELGYTYDGEDAADAIAVWHTYKKLYGNKNE